MPECLSIKMIAHPHIFGIGVGAVEIKTSQSQTKKVFIEVTLKSDFIIVRFQETATI